MSIYNCGNSINVGNSGSPTNNFQLSIMHYDCFLTPFNATIAFAYDVNDPNNYGNIHIYNAQNFEQASSSGPYSWNNLTVNGGAGLVVDHVLSATYDMGRMWASGRDNRVGVSSTDGSAKTIFTTPSTAAPLLYRLMARVFGRSGTITAATYVVKWTEGGVAISKSLSISAVDTDADLSILIQPDVNTAVTVQLTTLTGTSPVVDVACTVE